MQDTREAKRKHAGLESNADHEASQAPRQKETKAAGDGEGPPHGPITLRKEAPYFYPGMAGSKWAEPQHDEGYR